MVWSGGASPRHRASQLRCATSVWRTFAAIVPKYASRGRESSSAGTPSSAVRIRSSAHWL